MTRSHGADVASLEHELLIARDHVLGLRAENERLREQLDKLRNEPMVAALERIEQLEEQREALVSAIGEERAATYRVVEQLRASRTWKAGRLVLAPLTIAKRLRRSGR